MDYHMDYRLFFLIFFFVIFSVPVIRGSMGAGNGNVMMILPSPGAGV